MQCVLGFACATGENLTDVRYAWVKEPSVVPTHWALPAPPFLSPYHGPPRD